MNTTALYLVRMDVGHDRDTLFNEVYDKEHLPNLRGVPGVRSAHRYRQPAQFAKTFRRHHGAPPSTFRGARRALASVG